MDWLRPLLNWLRGRKTEGISSSSTSFILLLYLSYLSFSPSVEWLRDLLSSSLLLLPSFTSFVLLLSLSVLSSSSFEIRQNWLIPHPFVLSFHTFHPFMRPPSLIIPFRSLSSLYHGLKYEPLSIHLHISPFIHPWRWEISQFNWEGTRPLPFPLPIIVPSFSLLIISVWMDDVMRGTLPMTSLSKTKRDV